MELLVDVDLKGDVACNTGGFNFIPLPSERDLWEPTSSAKWTARYKASEAASRNDKVLTILDLGRARRALGVEPSDESEEGRLVARVSKWCENLDEFGMMVWMAVMLAF